MPSVIDDPRKVAGRERGIEHAVNCRFLLDVGEGKDLLGTDQQLAVHVQAEVTSDAGAGTIRTDQEPCPYPGCPVPTGQLEGAGPPTAVPRP